MVDWNRFQPKDFDYDFDRDKLAVHDVEFEETVECFYSEHVIRKNKDFQDRFQLLGQTLEGRKLKIIFQLKPGRVVRIITGWPV
ncbi:MAG TPA: hypothetical protein VJ885_19795 [Thermoanaerobaculia bacterium]|nr:hypothetical protein [Thermoanaerobaculia bacterium]